MLEYLDNEQRLAAEKLAHMHGGIAWWACGEGKTRIGLGFFAILQTRIPSICLVVCRRAAFYDWREEIQKCKLNYYVSEYQPESNDYSRQRPTIWLLSHAQLPNWKNDIIYTDSPIHAIIYDELYFYSNVKSARSKSAIAITKALGCAAIGLSGTIMPARDNASVWGQASAIGIQRRLAKNLTEFRSKFQRSFFANFGNGKQTVQWTNAPNWKERVFARLQPYISVHFPKGSRRIHQRITHIPATKEQLRAIKLLKEEYYHENLKLDIKTALELIVKTQQIACGWVKDKDGNFPNIKSNKLGRLLAGVEELLAEGEKVLIWCAFRHDVEIIAAAAPFATLQYMSGKPFDSDAWKNGLARVVVATEGSGSSVNHFSQVRYAKYFSMSFRWLDLQQSQGRINRKDSRHDNCHYEYLLVDETLDEHIYKTATRSGSDEREFIRSCVTWLKA